MESEAELDNERPAWARGSITPVGMRTGARDRFTKDDRRLRYPWVGWDTRRLLQELDDELESIQRELQVADVSVDETNQRRDSARGRLDELRAIRADLTWDRIDPSVAQERMGELETQLAQASSPQVARLTELLQKQREKAVGASREVKRLEEELERLDKEWGDLVAVVDEAKDRVETAPPLIDDERAALAATPFTAPVGTTGVAASLTAAIAHLRQQIERHKEDREKLEAAIVGHIAAYRKTPCAPVGDLGTARTLRRRQWPRPSLPPRTPSTTPPGPVGSSSEHRSHELGLAAITHLRQPAAGPARPRRRVLARRRHRMLAIGGHHRPKSQHQHPYRPPCHRRPASRRTSEHPPRRRSPRHQQLHPRPGRDRKSTACGKLARPRTSCPPDNLSPGHPCQGRGDTGVRGGVTLLSPNPPRTTKEPPPPRAGTDTRARPLPPPEGGGGDPDLHDWSSVEWFFAELGPEWPLSSRQVDRLTPLVATALADGWTSGVLAAHVGANSSGVRNPYAVLNARLQPDELPPSPRTAKGPSCPGAANAAPIAGSKTPTDCRCNAVLGVIPPKSWIS